MCEQRQDVATTTTPPATTSPIKKKKKKVFMLHDPKSFACLARFTSTNGARAAANKAAVRGHTDILLRETGTKWVHRFRGEKIKMDPPHEVVRNGVTVQYKNKSVVVPVGKKFLYEGTQSLESMDSCDDPSQP